MPEQLKPASDLGEEFQFPSEAMQQVYSLVDRIAPTDLDVLIVGEEGVGKEVLARRIHRRSDRAALPFLKVQAPRLAAAWMDSSLLGMKGYAPEWSALVAAGAATLFIPELTALDQNAQAALLHIILDRESLPQPNRTNGPVPKLRIIAATSSEIDEEVKAGRLREDLVVHLGVITVRVPPLRTRPADIRPLFEYFVGLFSPPDGSPIGPGFLRSSGARLLDHRWPGNTREVRELVQELVRSGADSVLKDALVDREPAQPSSESAPPVSLSLADAAKLASDAVERQLIVRALEENGWNRRVASVRLRISYRTLLEKMRRHQLT